MQDFPSNLTRDASPIRIPRMRSCVPLAKCMSLKIRQWGHRWGMDFASWCCIFTIWDASRTFYMRMYTCIKSEYSRFWPIYSTKTSSHISNISFWIQHEYSIHLKDVQHIKNIFTLTALGLLMFIFNSSFMAY